MAVLICFTPHSEFKWGSVKEITVKESELDNIKDLKIIVFYSRSTTIKLKLATQNSGRTPFFFCLIGGKRPCLEYMEKLSDNI